MTFGVCIAPKLTLYLFLFFKFLCSTWLRAELLNSNHFHRPPRPAHLQIYEAHLGRPYPPVLFQLRSATLNWCSSRVAYADLCSAHLLFVQPSFDDMCWTSVPVCWRHCRPSGANTHDLWLNSGIKRQKQKDLYRHMSTYMICMYIMYI